MEREAGVELRGGQRLGLDAYLSALKSGPRYPRELAGRVPRQAWDVIRRGCPYLQEWGEPPSPDHQHVWCFPEGVVVTALFYRKDLFAEAGLPDRAPATMDELFEFAKKLTNPREDRYGLSLYMGESGWGTLSFLYSNGGRLVGQDAAGAWRCRFNDSAATDAYYYVARLFHEPFENRWGKFSNVVYAGEESSNVKYAMIFKYLDIRFFTFFDAQRYGFGPAPLGPGGRRGAEFNADPCGIYAGIEDPRVRDAAWKYVRFFDSPEARRARARAFVENGAGQFVSREMLEATGYPEYARQIPPGWEEARRAAMEAGVPEPYGRNCSQVYAYASKAVDQIRTDAAVTRAVESGDEAAAKSRVREILDDRVPAATRRCSACSPRRSAGPGTRRRWRSPWRSAPCSCWASAAWCEPSRGCASQARRAPRPPWTLPGTPPRRAARGRPRTTRPGAGLVASPRRGAERFGPWSRGTLAPPRAAAQRRHRPRRPHSPATAGRTS